MSARGWLALSVRVMSEDRPRLDGLLFEWSTVGLIEEEASEEGMEQLTAHFSSERWDRATLESSCREAFASPPFQRSPMWRVREEPDLDWMAPAREHFSGFRVGDRIGILPPWAPGDHPLARVEIALRIDPGMAFGTGSHESTRLTLGWMADLMRDGMSVLDLGAGSAILSIAAARMGAGRIVAVDIDADAEENARRNLALNGANDRVDYRVADLAHERLAPADLVVCNTLVEIFEPHLARLRDLTRPGGALVLAGLLVADEAAVLEGLRAVSLTGTEIRRESEWSSICARRR